MPASQHVFALAVALAVAAAPASGGQFGFLKRDSKTAFQAFNYDSAFIRMAESFKTGAAKPGLVE
jgi:hypothetical protein